jgi:hypothetical protein
MYTTAAQDAARIRADYKARGWNSRMISVRASSYSMGSSINVEIKDPRIPMADASAIAMQAEHIHRCEITGEILGGGNRYVHVSHSPECQTILGRRYLAAIEDAIACARADNPNECQSIHGTAALLGIEGSSALIHLDGQKPIYCGLHPAGIAHAAYLLACAIEGGE